MKSWLAVVAVLSANFVVAAATTYQTCTLFGDVHYLTFDGAHIDYQGVCKHQVAKFCGTSTATPFAIYASHDNFASGTQVSWLAVIDIEYRGHTIEWNVNAGPMVDGSPVNLPYSIPHVFDLELDDNNFLQFKTVDGPYVEFDGHFQASIKLSDVYSSSVCGICGNFDGNKANDLKTMGGIDVSGHTNPGQEIGDSWVVNDPTYANCFSENPTPTSLPSCTNNYACDTDMCDQLNNPTGLYGSAVQQLPTGVAQHLRDDCILDSCFTQAASLRDSIAHLLRFVKLQYPDCTQCPTTLTGFPRDYQWVNQQDTSCDCASNYCRLYFHCGYWCDCMDQENGWGTRYTCWTTPVDGRCLDLGTNGADTCTASHY